MNKLQKENLKTLLSLQSENNFYFGFCVEGSEEIKSDNDNKKCFKSLILSIIEHVQEDYEDDIRGKYIGEISDKLIQEEKQEIEELHNDLKIEIHLLYHPDFNDLYDGCIGENTIDRIHNSDLCCEHDFLYDKFLEISKNSKLVSSLSDKLSKAYIEWYEENKELVNHNYGVSQDYFTFDYKDILWMKKNS